MKKTELLSPAGSFESLRSAVRAGADAVYLGAEKFSARAYAENFDSYSLKKATDYAHERGVRIYGALNTLITDKNIFSALSLAERMYLDGVDALIVTDIGLISLLRKYLPDLELHFSTQAGCHNSIFAEGAKNLGLSRVVLAREMSIDDISLFCKNSPLPTEVFIHGALCVCHSGQCLLSSVIGGRSGNRGECAQPCRMKYNGRYPLSLKDLCAADCFTDLLDTGVSSLKIEGRMKSPDYVYAVTALYRELIDERRNATPKEIRDMAEVFSRGGFTSGYLRGKIDDEMLGIRSKEDKRASRNVRKEKVISFDKKEPITLPPRNGKIPDEKEIKNLQRRTDTISEKVTAAFFEYPDNMPDSSSFFDITYLPLERYSSRANGLCLPPIIFDRELPDVESALKRALENGAEHVLCHQLWQADFVKKIAEKHNLKTPALHASHRFGIYSNKTLSVLKSVGFEDMVISPELILPAMRDLSREKSVIVYGRLPVMTLEKPVGEKELKDRTGRAFPIIEEGGRNILFNSVPIYEADRKDILRAAGINNCFFIFSTESKREVENVIEAYKKGLPARGEITRIKIKPIAIPKKDSGRKPNKQNRLQSNNKS